MWSYSLPPRDMQFVIEVVLRVPAAWREMSAFAEFDAKTARELATVPAL